MYVKYRCSQERFMILTVSIVLNIDVHNLFTATIHRITDNRIVNLKSEWKR